MMNTGEDNPLYGLRLLIVEDSPIIADLIAEELRFAGCEVVGPVPNVELGLRHAANERLDGALLDVDLGSSSSAPIADMLAARRIPFLFITGHSEPNIPDPHDAAPCLHKPFRLAELLDTLAQICNAPPLRADGRIPIENLIAAAGHRDQNSVVSPSERYPRSTE